MTIDKIPERIRWAVEQLELAGDESVLEIGCGRGVAAALVCERLEFGRLVAIDRSDAAITAARNRPEMQRDVASGKAVFRKAALADFDGDGDGEPFDLVFAINVNLFWLRARRELAVIARVLKRRGRLLLVYEPPSANRLSEIEEQARHRLDEAGFIVTDVRREQASRSSLLGIAASVREG